MIGIDEGVTPAAAGFRLAPDWMPHARCWIAWPCRAELWGDGLDAARRAYAEVAQAIHRFEPVTVIARPEDVAEASLLCGEGIGVLPLEIDDSWVRDTGPTFLLGDTGEIAGCNWRFNAWGGKYAHYAEDARLARRLLDHLGLRCFDAPFVLEGGAVHGDGEGTVIATESVLLNDNRNPGLGREEMERLLGAWLGAETVIWLPGGLGADETDGHVDNVACFARPGVVLALDVADEDDPDAETLEENLRILSAARDARGRSLEVVTVERPLDAPAEASYLNFCLVNGGIVVPVFDDPGDEAACRILAAAFPDRELVAVNALDIVRGGGGIHCIVLPQPRGTGDCP